MPTEPTTSRATDLVSDGVLSVPEAATFTGLGRTEIYNRMTRGELPFVKLGKRRMIPRKALVAMLAAGLVTAER